MTTGIQTIQPTFYSVADSFTLSSAATNLSANVWLDEYSGFIALDSLQWTIVSGSSGSNPYTDPVVASGTATSITSIPLGPVNVPVALYAYENGFSRRG